MAMACWQRIKYSNRYFNSSSSYFFNNSKLVSVWMGINLLWHQVQVINPTFWGQLNWRLLPSLHWAQARVCHLRIEVPHLESMEALSSMLCLQRRWWRVRVLFFSLSVEEVSVAHTFFRQWTTARPQTKKLSNNKKSSDQSTKGRTSPTNLREAEVTGTYRREAWTLEEMPLIW
jgi:hypothetical protein